MHTPFAGCKVQQQAAIVLHSCWALINLRLDRSRMLSRAHCSSDSLVTAGVTSARLMSADLSLGTQPSPQYKTWQQVLSTLTGSEASVDLSAAGRSCGLDFSLSLGCCIGFCSSLGSSTSIIHRSPAHNVQHHMGFVSAPWPDTRSSLHDGEAALRSTAWLLMSMEAYLPCCMRTVSPSLH